MIAPRTPMASERRIGLAALLTGLFLLAEITGALASGSLVLLAGAYAHRFRQPGARLMRFPAG